MDTPHRSLGLRRHAASAAAPAPAPVPSPQPVLYADQAPYGLHRGFPRRRVIPAGVDTAVVEVPAVEPVAEFIEPVAESDIIIDGVDTTAPAVEPEPYVDPTPGFFDWHGELVPFEGHFTSRAGERFFNGAPAFLFEDRPASNIR